MEGQTEMGKFTTVMGDFNNLLLIIGRLNRHPLKIYLKFIVEN